MSLYLLRIGLCFPWIVHFMFTSKTNDHRMFLIVHSILFPTFLVSFPVILSLTLSSSLSLSSILKLVNSFSSSNGELFHFDEKANSCVYRFDNRQRQHSYHRNRPSAIPHFMFFLTLITVKLIGIEIEIVIPKSKKIIGPQFTFDWLRLAFSYLPSQMVNSLVLADKLLNYVNTAFNFQLPLSCLLPGNTLSWRTGAVQ